MDTWLVSAARRAPDRPALITAAGTLSYAQLLARATAAAGQLRHAGAGAGDQVAVALPAGEAFVVAVHAAWLLGAVVVPVDLRLTEREREQRVSAALVVDEPLRGEVGAVGIAELDLQAPAAVLYTSGSTAEPKPVTLSYRNFLASALGSAVALGLDPRERWLCPMPPVHVGGLSVLVRSAIYATTAVLHPGFDAERVLAELHDPHAGLTLVSLVPTMLSRLLDAGLTRPASLRWALLGGGPIAPALLARAEQAGVPVAATYGMTESCSQIATGGWPLPGVEVRLADDGEIMVRGDIVSCGSVADDGWLYTGDLGVLDERGRLHITGRRADTIVSGGENVAPAEVEAVLLAHPAVADAGVYPRADLKWGEAVVAAVVLRPGRKAAPEELRRHCAARLAAFKVPKQIELVELLPRTPTGKLLRRELPRTPV